MSNELWFLTMQNQRGKRWVTPICSWTRRECVTKAIEQAGGPGEGWKNMRARGCRVERKLVVAPPNDPGNAPHDSA